MKQFRRTTIISVGLLAFLIGLVVSKTNYRQFDMVIFLTVSLFVIVLRKRTLASMILIIFLGLMLGLWRGGHMSKNVARYDKFVGRTVVTDGRVIDDPVYDDEGRLDFRIGGVTVDGQPLPGQVRVKTHASGILRGDSLHVSGKLSGGFGNYQASMYFATVEVSRRVNNPIDKLRREFFASVYNVLPEPQASLGLGFLVGLRSALPEELGNQLRVAGLTHIVVASGYNLTVLVRLCRRLLAKYSKYQAFVGSVILIIGFLSVTGASPSMVRASVVTILSLLAWYYGRKFQPVLIILLGAALTAGYNPLFIWHDLGWWLSFLAFAGVLVVAPLITARFWKKQPPPLLAQVAIETSSAQLMATPLILFVFGEVSLVALLANIAVVPLIPFAMAGTFAAGISNIMLPGTWGALVGVPANITLSYIVSVTRFFASPAWAQQAVSIGVASMAVCYLAVVFLVAVLYGKSRIKFRELPSVVE